MVRLMLGMTVATLVLVGAGGCNGTGGAKSTLEACIQPPAEYVKGEDKVANEITAKLAKLDVEATAKSEFGSTLQANFSKLSDRNVSLLLFLRAIDCYLEQGVVGEELARDFARMVREEWSEQAGFRGTDGPLTPLERGYIQRYEHSDEIFDYLRSFGIG